MAEQSAGNMLLEMTKRGAGKKSKITLEMAKETLAELKAAAIIFGAKSYSSLVHQQIVLKIREAGQMVSKEDFEKLRDEQMKDIESRSRVKTAERRKINEKTPDGAGFFEDVQTVKNPKNEFVGSDSHRIETKGGESLRFVEEGEGFDEEK